MNTDKGYYKRATLYTHMHTLCRPYNHFLYLQTDHPHSYHPNYSHIYTGMSRSAGLVSVSPFLSKYQQLAAL